MQPLIDADVLRYEIGAVGQYVNDSGDLVYRDWDWVALAFDDRVRDICGAVGATEAPILYLTGDRKLLGDQYTPNFREASAVGKVYKGTRKSEKPFHYRNLTAYICATYNTRIANGCEADDLICIEQHSRLEQRDTIICTRDKDLRQATGWHYGWECGKQPEFGPVEYDGFGTISLVKMSSGHKIVGGGRKFFYSQLLTGDSVDNIGGLKGSGPVKAYGLLSELGTDEECQAVIIDSYKSHDPDNWLQSLQEQSDLLWIVKELNEDGSYKRFLWQNT